MTEPVDDDAPEGGNQGDAPEASDAKGAGDGTRDPQAEAAPEKSALELAKAEASKFREQLLRTAADLDNFRKRTRRDIDDAQKKGAEELLRALLPVFDNLERAVLHAEQAADAKAIADGVRMVLKQFGDTLSRAGIQRVPGVGEPFDPMVHEAVQQVESKDAKPGTVVAEVQPGYRMGDRLIRAAMVVVSKAPQTTSRPPPEAN